MKTFRIFGVSVVDAILAVAVLAVLGVFTMQQQMEELAVEQQLSHYYKFRSQVASVCERVKINPNENQISSKEFIVMYPSYDIRFYNQTGDMPKEVQRVCRGDKCACLLKQEKGSTADWLACAGDVACIRDRVKIQGVYSCFNMQELGCNNEIWFEQETPIITRALRDYNKNILYTCKSEGRVSWGITNFFYEKLSDKCIEEEEL